MTRLNPRYGFILPFLFIFTIPVAIFATITTISAFSVLCFRVITVYLELALAVIPHYLLGSNDSIEPVHSIARVPARRRIRRDSSSSVLSAGSITPAAGGNNLRLNQGMGHARDYEGVGGWRLAPPDDDDALWTKINSRLELPADHGRRHRRSSTMGSVPSDERWKGSFTPETVMNTSRVRTSPSAVFASDGYLPHAPSSPSALKRTPSVLTPASSSGSPKPSSVLNMKQR